MNRKIHLLSFSDSRLKTSAERFRVQSEDSNFFDSVKVFSENDLSQSFKEQFKNQLLPTVRGFGYWCWKPEIILSQLLNVKDDDIVIYADVGFWINKNGKNRFENYLSMLDRDECGLLAFECSLKNTSIIHDGRTLFDLPDFKWIKGDLLDYFNVRHVHHITSTPTIGAGLIFIRNNKKSRQIIEQWLSVFKKDFSLLDDTISKRENLQGFIENRHDQAAFSILCKMNKISTVSAYEYWYPSKNSIDLCDWSELNSFPFWARRDLVFKDPFSLKITSRILKRIGPIFKRLFKSYKFFLL